MDAVRVPVDATCGGLEGEPCLAGSSGSDEREQAAVGVVEQAVDRIQLGDPADEGRAWQRQVLHPGFESSSAAGTLPGALSISSW